MPTTRTPRITQPDAAPARKVSKRARPPASKTPAAPAPSKTAVAVTAPAPKAARKNDGPRPKLVRDSFTMPEADFALIPALKERALKAQRATKKSELLRAGLQALAALDDKAFIAALGKIEPVKTGRPKKGR
jgi:hypothetical protein